MTVYARGDISAVSISPAHGGCGTSHVRPAPGGNPVPIWGLTCHGGCEDVLRHDSLWSVTHTTIPETPDEVYRREDLERRGALDQQESTARALMELSKLGNLPDAISALLQHMSGNAIDGNQQTIRLCSNGHQNQSDAAFCSGCGVSLSLGVPTDRGKALAAAEPTNPDQVTPAENGPEDQAEKLSNLSLAKLRAIAKERGVAIGKTKDEQIKLLTQ